MTFPGSEAYWRQRYLCGGHSGCGSYGTLAQFKAEILNNFVAEHHISSVIEFGCGDGSQLRHAQYPHYLGFDVSDVALAVCRRASANDATRRFALMSDYQGERAELALSLDVLFHLVEDDIFERYMQRLFAAASRYVIIYSSNTDAGNDPLSPHIRHRAFTAWVASFLPEWALRQIIPNRFPCRGDSEEESFCDFYIYEQGIS